MSFLRQSHNVKPERWGSEADVQYAIAKNSEKIFGVDPDSNVLVMPLFFGFPCLDYSGKQNHGTPYGGVAYHSGSLDFDGVNDNVGIANNLSLNPLQISISAWIKHAGDASIDAILSKDHNETGNVQRVWQFRKDATNKLQLIVFKADADLSSVTGATTIADSTQRFVTGTWDGININVYVDGKRDATPVAYAGSLQQGQTNNALIGADETGSVGSKTNFFNGLIPDTRINNIVLTAEQIALFYARKWDLYRRVGRTYYSVAAAPSIYIPRIMIF